MTRFPTYCLSVVLASSALTQTSTSKDEQLIGVSITKLPPADYPPIALAAHVSGDVALTIVLKPDGKIDTVEVVNGPAMLKKSAIESASQTQFDCRSCNGANTTFKMIFRFDLGPSITCGPRDNSYPRVTQSANIIAITAQPFGTCDPAGDRVRSAKCLFLWKCGWR
jgi:TonB family protein